jgi:hypothetical protein
MPRSPRDVTDEAIARQGWPAERAQRVREYLEHRSEEQYASSVTSRYDAVTSDAAITASNSASTAWISATYAAASASVR